MTLKRPAPGMGTFSSFTVAPRDLAFLVRRVEIRHPHVGQSVRLRVGLGGLGRDPADTALVTHDEGVGHIAHLLELPPEEIRIEGDPSWEGMVPPKVAEIIKADRLFRRRA